MSATLTDHGCEARYIGGAMLDPGVLRDHPVPLGVMSAEHHRRVFEAMLTLFARGVRITRDSLDAELATLGYHADRSREPFDRMAQAFLEDAGIVAARLRELMARRQLHDGAREAIGALERGEALVAVQALLRRLADMPDLVDEDRTALESVQDAAATAIEDANRDGDSRSTVTTGVPAIDDAIIGWDRGDLIVVAGDSGAGKSTTMLLMANAQADDGDACVIVSLEDGPIRWGRRSVAANSSVPIRAMKRGDLSELQRGDLAAVPGRLKGRSIHLSYPLGGTLDEVLHAIRRARHQHGVTVAYVDYLQAIAMTAGSDEKAMRHHILECMEALRRETARGDTKLTVILGSQYKKRADDTKRPTDNDLYEANYIRQKADGIIHLWRDAKGTRRWAMTKHKDEDGCEGLLLREARTGTLSNGEATPLFVPPGQRAAQSTFDDREDFSDEPRRGFR